MLSVQIVRSFDRILILNVYKRCIIYNYSHCYWITQRGTYVAIISNYKCCFKIALRSTCHVRPRLEREQEQRCVVLQAVNRHHTLRGSTIQQWSTPALWLSLVTSTTILYNQPNVYTTDSIPVWRTIKYSGKTRLPVTWQYRVRLIYLLTSIYIIHKHFECFDVLTYVSPCMNTTIIKYLSSDFIECNSSPEIRQHHRAT